MRNGILGSIAALAASAGLAWGQTATPNGQLLTDPVPEGSSYTTTGEVQPAFFGAAHHPVPGSMGRVPLIVPPMAGLAGPGTPPGPMPIDPMGGQPTYPPPGNFGALSPSGMAQLAGDCPPGGAGGQVPHVWFNAQYLLWFVDSMPVNLPLATTSAPLASGVLGQPTTTALFEGPIDFDVVSGFRLTGGAWCNACKRLGIEVNGFLLEQNSPGLTTVSSALGLPVLARPFVDSTTGINTSLLASFPQFSNGFIDIDIENQVWGIESNTVWNIYRQPPTPYHEASLNLIGGFRYFEMDEGIRVFSGSGILPGNSSPFSGTFVLGPAAIGVLDEFETRNQFYGGQLGLQTKLRKGRWTVDLQGKIAIGSVYQRLETVGQSILQQGPANARGDLPPPTGVPGGLLANAGNSGVRTRNEFAYLPEGIVNIGFQWTPRFRTFIGYNIMYLDNVIRAGSQINPVVDVSQVPVSFAYGLPGFTPAPEQPFLEDDFWVQGINFGFELRY